ncbi:hypothetical protein ACJIZ3_014656 [Penstemon smallii]|uniref:Transmembrane protein n=1 Tax=Penstemon smallii TaxID=265156 RepID=A0ABD3RKI6_9LAMI
MGRSCFSLVLLSVLLMLLFSTGFGRKMVHSSGKLHEENSISDTEQGKSREMMELDYVYAEPNTNVRSGYLFPSSSPPPLPSPGLGF